jgi:hypothetical protein
MSNGPAIACLCNLEQSMMAAYYHDYNFLELPYI